MKKRISLLTVCLLIVGITIMAVVPASAATPKDTITDAVKAVMPSAYANHYVPMVENILQQIDVTEAQAAAVVKSIEACKEVITEDKGASLSDYTEQERTLVLEQFDKACDALNLKYEVSISTTPAHEGDIICVVYDASGKKLGDIDGDAVKKTNTANEVNYGFAALAVVLMVGTVAAAIYGKKAVSSR